VIEVTVCCAPAPRVVFEQCLQLRAGSTLRAAVEASDLARLHPALDWAGLQPGVWGRPCAWERVLQAGDRVELCRPLSVDPKVARRERFQRQGSRTAGLFAKRRAGGKAGY
jgi:putative ubiquitin-RnfH superfamily antitoxin RatB of RatAB toxin-antitoxin module